MFVRGCSTWPKVASALDDVASALLFWREDMTKEVTTVSMLPEAETLASRALDISRGSLGVEHPITAGREHNLGMIQRGLGREDEARCAYDHYRFCHALYLCAKPGASSSYVKRILSFSY